MSKSTKEIVDLFGFNNLMKSETISEFCDVYSRFHGNEQKQTIDSWIKEFQKWVDSKNIDRQT